MSSPYPHIDRWVIPADVFTATLAGVKAAGRRGNESGAFWLGDRAELAGVRAVVLPAGAGVEERPGQWCVSPDVFGVISRWAKPLGLTLLGIAHSHGWGVPVRLSKTDRCESVQVPGILAVIIGNGGSERDHDKWGWYVHEHGDYREFTLAERALRLVVPQPRGMEVWRADAQGVRAWSND